MKPLTPGQRNISFEELTPRLHNLEQDPSEENNLIDQFPEIAERMQKTLDQIRFEGSELLATEASGAERPVEPRESPMFLILSKFCT